MRPPRSQAKWYSFTPNQEKPGQDTGKTVSTWSTDASEINSTYSRIAKAAGIASTPPASRQISQDNLRRWEKSAREASTICNQAAAFNRCLYKVQDSMQAQLKVIKTDFSKGKSSSKVSQAADELQFLMNFNSSITQSMAKTLEHLTDFVFVTVANTTLARRDSYLSHLKLGIKPDTFAALRTGPNVPNVVQNPPVGARLQNFWQTWLGLGASPAVVQILREGYTLPFRTRPNLTRFPTVVSCYVNPHRNSYLLEALHQLMAKHAIELVRNQTSLGFFKRLFLVPKPNNKWRPILDLSKLNIFLKVGKFKMETPETIRTSLQKREWVTSVDFKDAYFHIPIQEQSRKYLRFHIQGRTYQFKALPFGLSTAPMEFTVLAKEVKLMAMHQGIRIHQYLDDWLVRAGSQQVCLHHTQTLVKMCHELGWLVNMEKSELEPKQIFDFVGYQFDLRTGRVRPTMDRWQNLQVKIQALLLLPACPVRQFMSLIGLLTATEKQVHLGLLHMRPIQWHLKNNWRVPESLEKIISLPRSLHPHLQWWLDESNVLQGQPLHPVEHALQIFTDASKEGWGAHLNELTARGSWSVPESKLHINYLELKAVFLALKEFQELCTGKIVLVASDNTTVVAYINKEGGMRSGPLCALLWRILTWCSQKQVTLKARHIPGHLNVIADKLSRLGQTIQTEWSLLLEVFLSICKKWHQPQVDLFATRFNHKLPQFVSPVPDPLAVAVDALTLPWEDLDAYAFPPTSILGKVVEKLLDSRYQRVILIAPGWPNMPWFWDLVAMSSQIPLSLPNLPNLLTQPFNQIPHRNLTNLNLHAWLLEPQQSRNRVSLRQWQQELRLLKENQPDQSMRQSGPFLQSGASLIRWTSGHHL